MEIKAKVEYVKNEVNKNKCTNHHCHWPGCPKVISAALWGCPYHWTLLPAKLRNKIWRAYNPGQEKTKTPSKEYIQIAREVQIWIKLHGSQKEKAKRSRFTSQNSGTRTASL